MARLLILLSSLALGGCGTLSYYTQSVRGQFGVMAASRPLNEVVVDPDTPESVRRQLRQLPALRQFAVEQLDLPETESYQLYADVQRDVLLWNLVATPVDSLVPKEWCYPVVGCAAYRGYFSRRDAETHAAQLAQEGWDTAVQPVPAYSTLGWFSDPLPSTVIGWPLPDIAGLVFHELAHESLYLRGESEFNEAYATVVEQEGVRRWLQQHGTAGQRRAHELAQQRRQVFLELIGRTRVHLEALYAADVEREELLRQKASILQAMSESYLQLRQNWGGYAGYDRWFDRPLNNAHLASVNTYHALAPAFRQILKQVDGDMAAFHDECRAVAGMQPEQREAAMNGLLDMSADLQ